MIPLSTLSVILRAGIVAIIALLWTFSAVQWGKNACRAAQEAANAKIRGEHAETVNRADRGATERALDAQEKDLTNAERVKEIAIVAGDEPGADDLCLSADVVERLRELQ